MEPDQNIKWNTRQRLAYIESRAFYTGSVSRSDVATTFAMSDPAATKDIKLYNDLAPGNLIYKQSEFGFIPSAEFKQTFSDLDPASMLHLISHNYPSTWLATNGAPVFGLSAETLPFPTRLPDKNIVAHITRAIHQHKKLSIEYASLRSQNDAQSRIIEPHSIVNTGLRWHARAYNEENFDFRDFVLSRITAAELIDEPAESSAEYDEDWTEMFTLELAPHPGLSAAQQASLLTDYGANEDVIYLKVRRALIAYSLHALSVDTTLEHSLNPNAFQLILLNREEIEFYASWALL